MTCIVGIVGDDGEVWIGADSAGTDGWLGQTIRADSKVFTVGPFILGFTSSFRMGQLLRYSLSIAEQTSQQTDDQYMCTTFIDAVRKTLREGGYMETKYGVEEGGSFLVGYRGTLYEVHSDFQVGIPVDQYAAIGCGGDFAVAVLDVLDGDPEYRIMQALGVAAYRSAGVAEPFTVLRGGKK